ncbi:hypothetical protein F2Q70_00003009 [Brassica cretica]|uniref:Uncharacterized protein n=1 Tax=Brassica cretica TaxID=69181 RepID=A0A8S9J0A5_BRACR|nr:hypothetical protein F2Q70_00003009 [Brassica cretica]
MAIDAYQKLPCFSPFFVTRSENKDDDGHDSILAQAETKSTQALEIRTDLAQASSMSLASKLPRQACHNWHKLFSPDKKRSRCVPSMDKASPAVAVPFRQSSQDVTVVVLWRGKQRRFVTREEDLIQETLRHFDWSLLFCCDTPRTLDQIMEPDIVGNCC